PPAPAAAPSAPAAAPSAPAPPPALAPANIVRVDLARLDELMRMVGDLVISRARLEDNLARLEETVPANQLRPLRETNQAMERQLRQLRQGVMRVRLVPVGEIFARMQFVVRDLARERQKKVTLELSGQETEIDKFVVERMMDPLLHLVRNALSHGIESEEERVRAGKPPEGKIALRAIAAGEMVALEIEDDGRGVDAERVVERARALGLLGVDTFGKNLCTIGTQIFGSTPPGKRAITSSLSLQARGNFPAAGADSKGGQGGIDSATLLDILCAPGFSTREQADLTSGRGVGMAIVKNRVLELGGTLTLETQPGTGSRFRIQLPLTLAIADALIVSVAGQTFAVPQSCVGEAIEVQPEAVTVFENSEIISYRGGVLPIVRLARLFGLSEPQHRGEAAPRKVGPGGRSEEFPARRSPSLAPAECERTPPPESSSATARFYAFVVGSGLNAVGIAVDRILGLREIVVRPLTDPLVSVPGIAGATELGDGRVVLIIDAPALTRL
ncbi:chemotaxis protein CheA, partial [Kamptonema formosum]|uniref:chemotaxis protein CheA n=1 Tax=Kamptonema formosum TaxID=331992 RepID=UPI000370C384